MFAKLNVALIAVLIGMPTAFAGQSNGRDSVYAQPGTGATLPSSGGEIGRHGRDSVYAKDTKPSTPISAAVTFKPGRA